MRAAFREAEKAFDSQEVPVGAVVVLDNRIIGRGYNATERLKDVTAHAEIIAITAACDYIDSKYLPDCTIYVTLEPCLMCAGALKWAQIGRIVYAAADEKQGFMRYGREVLHPKTKLEYGVMESECGSILQEFFLQKRSLKA